MKVKIGNEYKDASVLTNVSGAWKTVLNQYVKVDGTWRNMVKPSGPIEFNFIKKPTAPVGIYQGALSSYQVKSSVFGGYVNGVPSKKQYIWRSYTSTAWSTFETKWEPAVALANATYTSVSGGGSGYAQGGVLSNGTLNKALYQYNASAEAWETIQYGETLPMTRAPWINIGNVTWVVSTKDTNVYSRVTGRAVPDTIESASPYANQASAPDETVGFIAEGNNLWCSGGRAENSNVLWRYDALGNTWSKMANMPGPLYGHQMFHFDGRLYTIGGWTGSKLETRMFVYDIPTNSWSVHALAAPFTSVGGIAWVNNGRLFYGFGAQYASPQAPAYGDVWELAIVGKVT